MKGPEAIISRYSDHFHQLRTLPRLGIGPLSFKRPFKPPAYQLMAPDKSRTVKNELIYLCSKF
jgi:hypothetical protein